MSLEQELAAIRAKARSPIPVTPDDVLEHLDKTEEDARNYQESPTATAATLDKLNHYRALYGVGPEIPNAKLIELLAENEYLPSRPTVEDDRSIFRILRDVLFAVDAKYCAWTDSKSGIAVFCLLVAVLTGGVFAFCLAPTALERKEIYNKGYQACQMKVEAGLPCE